MVVVVRLAGGGGGDGGGGAGGLRGGGAGGLRGGGARAAVLLIRDCRTPSPLTLLGYDSMAICCVNFVVLYLLDV